MRGRRRFRPATITGNVDWRAISATVQPDLANLNAPRDRAEFRQAAHDMAARGIGTNDIAVALHLTPLGVRELLTERIPGKDKPGRGES